MEGDLSWHYLKPDDEETLPTPAAEFRNIRRGNILGSAPVCRGFAINWCEVNVPSAAPPSQGGGRTAQPLKALGRLGAGPWRPHLPPSRFPLETRLTYQVLN